MSNTLATKSLWVVRGALLLRRNRIFDSIILRNIPCFKRELRMLHQLIDIIDLSLETIRRDEHEA